MYKILTPCIRKLIAAVVSFPTKGNKTKDQSVNGDGNDI